MSENWDNRSLENEPENNVPPERSAYSDAYYSAPREGRTPYGYNPARYYAGGEDSCHQGQIRLKTILVLCLVCVLIAGALGVGGLYLLSRSRREAPAAPSAEFVSNFYVQASKELGGDGPLSLSAIAPDTEPMAGEDIYRMACRQVVGVTTAGVHGGAVSGSGIIVSADGYILTSYHVIQTGYTRGLPITVVTNDGAEYEAKVAGTESDSDLAVLKIEVQDLDAAVLGDSDGLTVGERIYAVGNPMGDLPYTMTRGIVSARDRSIAIEENVTANMFQFDAAVNSGNSGGPVYNAFGQVVGVATAKYAARGIEGLGFAIPMADACAVANELILRGYVSGKAYLGLTLDASFSPAVARYYRLVPGAYVRAVEPDSAAQTAGLQPGDIITAVDDTAILTSDELVAAVKTYKAGDGAELTVYRTGEYITVSVTFGESIPIEVAEE